MKRMKHSLRTVLVLVTAILLLVPSSALAASEETVAPCYNFTASNSATDSEGNIYKLTGSCTNGGYTATSTTGFNTVDFDGTGKSYAYQKTVVASGYVSFTTGGYNSTSLKKTTYFSTKSGSTTANYTFVNTIDYVAGSHTVSCNGASCSGGSYVG